MFIRHGPCSKCGSRDNRAHYDDGSSYCFGCKDFKRGDRPYTPSEPKKVNDIRKFLSKDIPEKNREWLRKYISDDQIDEFFYWSPGMQRHVYIEYDRNDLIFWEARRVEDVSGGSGPFPKVISSGTKPFSLWGQWKETGVVCIVEDILSAIKVADVVGVMCLHGSIIPMGVFQRLGNNTYIKRVIIWLDADKLSEAAVYEKRFQSWAKEVAVVRTPLDPKAYSKEEIKEIITNAV